MATKIKAPVYIVSVAGRQGGWVRVHWWEKQIFIEPLNPQCQMQFEVFVALPPLAANHPIAPRPVLVKN